MIFHSSRRWGAFAPLFFCDQKSHKILDLLTRLYLLKGMDLNEQRSFIEDCIAEKPGAWQTLYDEHLLPLKRKIAYKVFTAGGGESDIDDLISSYTLKLLDNDYALLKDLLTYDKTIGAWFYNGLIFEFKTWLNRDIKKRNRYLEIDKDFEAVTLTSMDEIDVVEILDKFISSLSKKEQTFMRLYFKDNLSEDEIADFYGVKAVAVRVRKSRLKDKFISFLEKSLV